jgi:predicted ATPase
LHLVGRDAPCRRVTALIGALGRGHGDALVIVGEAGIGKTALLRLAREQAGKEVTVLRAVGLESESELPFAGLGDALRPLLPLIEGLPQPQAAALRTALVLDYGPRSPSPYALRMASLTLLTMAAQRRPALVLIDDAHWLDPGSAGALSFAARRLADEVVPGLVELEVAVPRLKPASR